MNCTIKNRVVIIKAGLVEDALPYPATPRHARIPEVRAEGGVAFCDLTTEQKRAEWLAVSLDMAVSPSGGFHAEHHCAVVRFRGHTDAKGRTEMRHELLTQGLLNSPASCTYYPVPAELRATVPWL